MTTNQCKWLRVEMAADDPTVADLFIFGFIGDWVDQLWEDIGLGFDSDTTAVSFQAELDALPDSVETIRLHVNSPGGDVFGAVTIANMLREQRSSKGRRVEASVEGLAASAASIVIQAGDPIRIADNGLIMIHDPWTGVRGNASEIRKVAAELDKITLGAIVPTYMWHSKLDAGEIVALMEATTWMSADEAIENGFATEKVEGLKAVAAIDPRALSSLSVPDKYRARVEAWVAKTDPDEPTGEPPAAADNAAEPADVLKLCSEAGCLDIAEELIRSGASLKDVRTRVAVERESRQKADARATEIRGLCEKAELDELADGYISGQMSLDSIRAHLTVVTAKLDGAEIDGSLGPDAGGTSKRTISHAEVYAARRPRLLEAGNEGVS